MCGWKLRNQVYYKNRHVEWESIHFILKQMIKCVDQLERYDKLDEAKKETWGS